MKKIYTILILIVISTLLVYPYTIKEPKPVYDKSGNMIAIYNIGTGLSKDELDFCSSENFSGKIVSIESGYPESSYVIQIGKRKESLSVNTESMSMADRSNFYESLLKTGKRVTVGAYMCGSGGFLYTTSVKAINSKKKSKR